MGGEGYYSVKLEEIPRNQGVPLISSETVNAVKTVKWDGKEASFIPVRKKSGNLTLI